MTSIATKQWRVGNASFLDAFVRAPRTGSDARARLVLVGIDVRMAGHGRGLSCLFANGETTEGEAAGSEEAGKDVHQAWSCPVPKQVYEHEVVAASGAAGSSTLSVTLIAANKKGDVDNESRRRRTIAVPMRPYLATRFANLRIGATAMVRNAVMQKASLHAIAACCAINVATVLVATGTAVAGARTGLLVRSAFAAACWCGFAAVRGVRKLNKLDQGERDGNLNEYVLESKRQSTGRLSA